MTDSKQPVTCSRPTYACMIAPEMRSQRTVRWRNEGFGHGEQRALEDHLKGKTGSLVSLKRQVSLKAFLSFSVEMVCDPTGIRDFSAIPFMRGKKVPFKEAADKGTCYTKGNVVLPQRELDDCKAWAGQRICGSVPTHPYSGFRTMNHFPTIFSTSWGHLSVICNQSRCYKLSHDWISQYVAWRPKQNWQR